MVAATVTSKGQVTIPKDVRDRMGIRPGDQIDFVESEQGYIMRKRIDPAVFERYRGYLTHLAGTDPDTLVDDLRGGRD